MRTPCHCSRSQAMRRRILGATACVLSSCVALPGLAQGLVPQAMAQNAADGVTTAEVRTAIAARRNIDSRAIRVDSFGGTVRLSGSAPSQGQIDEAEQAAADVDGVNHVLTDITPAPQLYHEKNNEALR